MARIFNIAGPCIPDKHYMLPPTKRIREVYPLIEQEEYFVLHAPRQSGKTTFLQHLADEINQRGERLALYVSLEEIQGLQTRQQAVPATIRAIADWANDEQDLKLKDDFILQFIREDPSGALGKFLRAWCAQLLKPLVLLLDEVDCLTDDALISVLRQLRAGYIRRTKSPFPSTIALVGMRDLRDYRRKIRPDEESLETASPFNIMAGSLTLRDFTPDEIATLYSQHTEETGQVFGPGVLERAYELTHGQPWLVNALARHCVCELVSDASQPISLEHIDRAKEDIILKRPTHLDSLMARLREARVQRVIEPILDGGELTVDPDNDDYLLTRDLGLIREEAATTVISNAIYREVIPRFLNALTQLDDALPNAGAFSAPDGGIAMLDLLRTFQQFWRENSEIWLDRYAYREAGPHLVLQAYLQRIVNANGTITREYAAGSGRLDLCITQRQYRYAVEIKAIRPHRGLERTQKEGLDQLCEYLDRLGLTEGCLLIFDQRKGRSWDDRIYERQIEHQGKTITIFGA